MIFSEEIICQICKKKYSKLGIASHVLHTHKMNPEIYRKQYIYKYKKCCSRAFYMIVPKLGTNEFYSFCFQKFFNKSQIDIIKKSYSIREAVEQIDNRLKYKRNYEIIRRFKKGILCH